MISVQALGTLVAVVQTLRGRPEPLILSWAWLGVAWWWALAWWVAAGETSMWQQLYEDARGTR